MTDLTQKKQKTNLILNCAHEFSWGFGVSFHTTYAVIPLFLKQLGAPDGVVISVAGLFSILIAIPQFLSAILGRNIKNIKKAVIASHTLVLPPMFLVGFVFAFLSPTGPQAWIFYYICFILYGLVIGFIIPIWTDFLSHVNPRETRGRFLGISFAFNSVGGFIGGILVKMLLDSKIPFPANFGWGFIILSVSLSVGILAYFGYHVKNPEGEKAHTTIKQFWHNTWAIIHTNSNFRRYLLSRIFITAHFPAMSLYAVYAHDQFGFDISEAGIFTILNVVSFGCASYVSGKIGDRFGHKAAIILSFISYLAATLTAMTAESMTGVYAIFIFLGIGQGGFLPSAMNLVYEFSGNGDPKTTMAIIDTLLMPFTIIAIILAGYFKPIVGTDSILAATVVSVAIGILLLVFIVKDPRKTATDDTISIIN